MREVRFSLQALIGLGIFLLIFDPAARAASPEAGGGTGGKDQVHVYLLNGMDPCRWGDLRGVGDEIRGWGFEHVTFGQFWDYRRFLRQIEAVRAADPAAKFVVIGFSAGAVTGEWLSRRMIREGIPVSLLVYLDGKWARNHWPEQRFGPPPPTLNVIAPALGRHSACRSWAENLRLHEGWHFGSPTHPCTLAKLRGYLDALAENASCSP